MKVEMRGLRKTFGGETILDDVDLTIESGELVALLGPSGSGKTTLLRILAGIEMPDSGAVIADGEDVTRVRARDRNVGLVFQHDALFRHLNVFENIAFPMRIRRIDKKKIADRVRELLALVHLEKHDKHMPDQLSGGQRQRVALARALASEPKILLLDEPFAALDAKVRVELRRWVRRLHEELHATTVFVTHDHEEAFDIADQVVIMNHARIEQKGSPLEVVQKPASRFVLDFIGNANVLSGSAQDGRAKFGAIEVEAPGVDGARAVVGYIRQEDIVLNGEIGGGVRAKVERVTPMRNGARVELMLDGIEEPFAVELDARRYVEHPLKRGETVYVIPQRVAVFPQ